MKKKEKKIDESPPLTDDPINNEFRQYLQKGLDLFKNDYLSFQTQKEKIQHIIREESLNNIRNGSNISGDSSGIQNEQTPEKDILLLMFLVLLKDKNELKSAFDQVKTSYDEVHSLITHEFKNILTSVHGYNMMLEKQLNKEKYDQLYNNLMASDRLTQQLFNMTDLLLKMSLGEKGLLKPEYKLIDFSENILKLVEADLKKQMVKKKMTIEKIKHAKNYIIEGDECLLDIVIRNLLLNAIKYGKANTAIFIEMTSEKNSFAVSVKNKCEKIPEHFCDGLFQKFQSKKIGSVKGGTGLGLYNVKNIIDLHNGNIECFTLPDEWIVFKFVIPQNN